MATNKQQKIAAHLLNQALHHLGELNAPYVLIIQGTPQVLTNVNELHALALLQASAQFQATLQEKTIEAQVERIVGESQWGGDAGDKA